MEQDFFPTILAIQFFSSLRNKRVAGGFFGRCGNNRFTVQGLYQFSMVFSARFSYNVFKLVAPIEPLRYPKFLSSGSRFVHGNSKYSQSVTVMVLSHSRHLNNIIQLQYKLDALSHENLAATDSQYRPRQLYSSTTPLSYHKTIMLVLKSILSLFLYLLLQTSSNHDRILGGINLQIKLSSS